MSLMGTERCRNSGNRVTLPQSFLTVCAKEGGRAVETLSVETHFDWKGVVVKLALSH